MESFTKRNASQTYWSNINVRRKKFNRRDGTTTPMHLTNRNGPFLAWGSITGCIRFSLVDSIKCFSRLCPTYRSRFQLLVAKDSMVVGVKGDSRRLVTTFDDDSSCTGHMYWSNGNKRALQWHVIHSSSTTLTSAIPSDVSRTCVPRTAFNFRRMFLFRV